MTPRTKRASFEAKDPGGEDAPDDEDQEAGDPHAARLDARTRHASLAENDGLADPDDENLSDLFASMGVEERLDELGM